MTEEIKQSIRKVQSVLSQIDEGTKIFFNISWYEKAGLTYCHNVWGKDSQGNKTIIGYKHFLTTQGKRILNTLV